VITGLLAAVALTATLAAIPPALRPGPPPKPPVPAVRINVPQPRQGGDTVADAFVIPEIPWTDSGTTTGYTDDYDEACPYPGSTSPDVVYALTPTEDVAVKIDLCGSSYDTKLYVYDEALEVVACNDDAYFDGECGVYVSMLENVDLDGGATCYLVVDGYGGDHGDYELLVEAYVPCVVDDPLGCLPENEPPLEDDYVDTHDGGCNSDPPIYLYLLHGWHPDPLDFCGTSGWYHYNHYTEYRDTDWFWVKLDVNGHLDVVLEAEQETCLYELGGDDCEDVHVVQTVICQPCVPDTLVLTGAGYEWKRIWVGPTTLSPPGGFVGYEYAYTLWTSGQYPSFTLDAATDDDGFGCQRVPQGRRLLRSVGTFTNRYDLADAGFPISTPGRDAVAEVYLAAGETFGIRVNTPWLSLVDTASSYIALVDDLRLQPGSILMVCENHGGENSTYYTAEEDGIYYLLDDSPVAGWGIAGGETINDEASDPSPPPPHDTCAGAPVIVPGPIAIDDDLTAATNRADPGRDGCTGEGDTGRDVVRRIDFTPGLRLDVVMTGDGDWDEALYLIRDCDDPQHTCVAGGVPEGEGVHLVYTSPVAETLWLVCDSWGVGPRPFTLTGELAQAVAADETPPAVTGLVAIEPNPFNPRTTVRFALERAGTAVVAIHDLAGRKVATLHDGPLGAGRHTVVWDGRDAAGRAVAAGTYVCRLTAAGVHRSRKLTLVR